MSAVCVSAVLTEVENQLAKFRDDLKKKLLKLPSTLEEQKKHIKYVQSSAALCANTCINM